MAPVPGPARRSAGGARGVAVACGGAVLGLLVSLILRQNAPWLGRTSKPLAGQATLPPWVPAPRQACARVTQSGVCVQDVFDAIDDAYRDVWPGSVDLLVRSHVSDKVFLLQTLLASVDLMWPKGVGDTVLVLDQEDTNVAALLPHWVKVFYEENYLRLPGKFLQQWSYAWADLYTTADFVAIMDDDCVLHVKVTPSLLFNVSEGLPYVVGSNRHQRNVWAQWSDFLVGRGKYYANFMVQLPFLAPRGLFPAFRTHVAKQHPRQGSYDRAFKSFTKLAKKFGRDQIQHAAFGNYLYHFMRDQVHLALEWTAHPPIPRVGVHVPWTILFYKGSNDGQLTHKVVDLFASTAAHYAHVGLCHALPPGELPGCQGTPSQEQVWMYAYDWADWPLLAENQTQLYDQHISEMHCMYRTFVEATKQEPSAAPAQKRESMVEQMKGCISTIGL